MTWYHVHRVYDQEADSYWVEAGSRQEARRLVALNVTEAADAQNVEMFGCEPSIQNKPLRSFIHRRVNGPVPIVNR